MKFLELLYGAEILSQSGDPAITGFDYDSRRIKPGFAFVAMKGESSDGNQFIDKAIAAGAVAVVSDSAAQTPRLNLAWALVPHGRRALAKLSANFYKRPAERLAITGITGTNGKSTTAFIVEAILSVAGRKSALIGTIEYHIPNKVLPAPHTTPEALELNQLLNKALGLGATDAVMEVSSHGLVQGRVFGMPFDTAVFTNLTRDHLDYHSTMDDYFAAKRSLFQGSGVDRPRVAVINQDDEFGQKLIPESRRLGSQVLTYGLQAGDFHAPKHEISARGTSFDLISPGGVTPIVSPLIGKVNVYNILAAAAAAHARGCALEHIRQGVANLHRVPGRFERVDCAQPFTIVVDYAHTDDALRNLISLARDFVQGSKRRGSVITLFGCGGDRDRTKRPLMGEAAGQGSDFVVLTSDNPRSEDPLAIINDALVGLQRSGAKYKIEPDRRKAIEIAIGQANAGDIVLLAGKGHERVQVTRDGSLPFDDVAVAKVVLLQAGYDCAVSAALGTAGSDS